MSVTVVVLIMSALIIPGIFIIINGSRPKHIREASKAKRFKKWYQFFSNFFITQSYLATIYSKLANLSIYRRDELQVLSVNYLLVSWGSALALIGVSLFMFNDFLTVLICLMFSLLLGTMLIDKQLDAMHYRVLKALANLLSSIRQEYMRYNNVVMAVEEAQVSPLLKKPLDDISQILVSTNGELKLQEFCESTPFRTIQTLAGICYHINNEGDEVDEHGQSNFIQALTLMLGDVNSEIQKTLYRNRRFGFIEYLPFVPILAMGLMESYFISIMPGTALIYNGPLGYLCRTLTVIISIIAYVVVSRVNCSIPIKEDDRGTLVLSLLERSWIRNMIHNITPKNKKRKVIEESLKYALSRMTVDQFYTKKVLCAFVAFVLAILCATSTISLGKDFIEGSTQQLSLVATGEMSEYEEKAIKELDETYLASPDAYNDIQLNELISAAMPGLSDLQKQDQVKRLKDKRKSLDNAYFKWWYIWICAGVGVIGWYGPNIALKMRRVLVQTEEEDDFLQLQTLVSILMNTNIDTLDLLHQLTQHTRVHKDMFLYAYQGYPSNPERELIRLQSKTSLIEFKRFIDKLRLSISDLSLKEAYSDLLIEREHILRIRDMTITSSIDRKRGFCGPLSMAPLGAMIIGEFLVPIGILGYNEFMNALNSM